MNNFKHNQPSRLLALAMREKIGSRFLELRSKPILNIKERKEFLRIRTILNVLNGR